MENSKKENLERFIRVIMSRYRKDVADRTVKYIFFVIENNELKYPGHPEMYIEIKKEMRKKMLGNKYREIIEILQDNFILSVNERHGTSHTTKEAFGFGFRLHPNLYDFENNPFINTHFDVMDRLKLCP